MTFVINLNEVSLLGIEDNIMIITKIDGSVIKFMSVEEEHELEISGEDIIKEWLEAIEATMK